MPAAPYSSSDRGAETPDLAASHFPHFPRGNRVIDPTAIMATVIDAHVTASDGAMSTGRLPNRPGRGKRARDAIGVTSPGNEAVLPPPAAGKGRKRKADSMTPSSLHVNSTPAKIRKLDVAMPAQAALEDVVPAVPPQIVQGNAAVEAAQVPAANKSEVGALVDVIKTGPMFSTSMPNEDEIRAFCSTLDERVSALDIGGKVKMKGIMVCVEALADSPYTDEFVDFGLYQYLSACLRKEAASGIYTSVTCAPVAASLRTVLAQHEHLTPLFDKAQKALDKAADLIPSRARSSGKDAGAGAGTGPADAAPSQTHGRLPSASSAGPAAGPTLAPAPARAARADEFDRAAKLAFDLDDDSITVSRAKSLYALNEADLRGLRCDNVANPHYRSAAPMRLYDGDDLIRACRRKYGGAAGLAAKLRKNAAAAAKRRANRMQNAAASSYRYSQYGGGEDEDEDEGDSSDSDSDSWDPYGIPCIGGFLSCGGTAAADCINEMCCFCCKEARGGHYGCSRHDGEY